MPLMSARASHCVGYIRVGESETKQRQMTLRDCVSLGIEAAVERVDALRIVVKGRSPTG